MCAFFVFFFFVVQSIVWWLIIYDIDREAWILTSNVFGNMYSSTNNAIFDAIKIDIRIKQFDPLKLIWINQFQMLIGIYYSEEKTGNKWIKKLLRENNIIRRMSNISYLCGFNVTNWVWIELLLLLENQCWKKCTRNIRQTRILFFLCVSLIEDYTQFVCAEWKE